MILFHVECRRESFSHFLLSVVHCKKKTIKSFTTTPSSLLTKTWLHGSDPDPLSSFLSPCLAMRLLLLRSRRHDVTEALGNRAKGPSDRSMCNTWLSVEKNPVCLTQNWFKQRFTSAKPSYFFLAPVRRVISNAGTLTVKQLMV